MSLDSLANQPATHYPSSATNEYGDATFGTSAAIKVRFQRTAKTKKLPTGETVTIEGVMYIPGDRTFSQGDKVVYGGQNYKIFSVKTDIDGQGNTFMSKVELLKWNI
jgi:hypothetical protein